MEQVSAAGLFLLFYLSEAVSLVFHILLKSKTCIKIYKTQICVNNLMKI